ncbi:hypothetical protein [Rhodoplanes roseus]|uniref:Minor tail protein n=1 Tax=Rhodoplanes roseus TaxID=29409 RepID=A0A327L2T9_9BRAD|nr:hypothetical protein [Rhodoplanes roseus]RAI44697.1 hypothetical protein CH341_07725 [Rhodoplanes roseus]
MALGAPYTTGTLSVTNGSTTVTGVGTLWASVAEVGDEIHAQGLLGVVKTVTGNAALELYLPWAGATASGLSYALLKRSWSRYDPAVTQAKVREYLAALAGSGAVMYVISGTTPDVGLGDDGDIAVKIDVSPWQTWTKVAGAWVEQAAPGSGAPAGADYLVKTAQAGLSAERVVTDTGTVTWDWATAGQAKANVVLSGAVTGRLARWGSAGALGQTSGLFEAADGKVGVGTASPAYNLHVVGTTTAFNTTDCYGGMPVYLLRRANGTPASPTAVIANDALFQLSAHGHDGTGFSARRAAIRAYAAENWSSPSAYGTYLTIETTQKATATTAERVRIDDAGNVGISTSSPTAPLHVAGVARIGSYTVATLPSASLVGAGSLAWVTDGSTVSRLGEVTGGGVVTLLVGSNGSYWLAL